MFYFFQIEKLHLFAKTSNINFSIILKFTITINQFLLTLIIVLNIYTSNRY